MWPSSVISDLADRLISGYSLFKLQLLFQLEKKNQFQDSLKANKAAACKVRVMKATTRSAIIPTGLQPGRGDRQTRQHGKVQSTVGRSQGGVHVGPSLPSLRLQASRRALILLTQNIIQVMS